MPLQATYKGILESLNVYADDTGLLSHRRPDGQVEQISVTVEGHQRRLVLPLEDLLRKGLPDELVAFHPLSELTNRSESEVFRKLKLLVNLRLTTVLAALLEDLIELAADKDRRKALPPKLLPLLQALPHADQKLSDNMHQLLNAAMAGGKNRLLSIYVSRGGKHKGEKHARVAAVAFPIIAELDDPDRKVYGVQLRAKDIPQIKALFDFILPNSDTVGTYNAASDSMDAPNFEVLMLAYVRVASQLNKIVAMAGKYLDDAASLKTDLSWASSLDDLHQLSFEIPPLDGNKGISVGNGNSEQETEPPKSGLAALQSRLSEPTPVHRAPAAAAVVEPERRVEIEETSKSSINTDAAVEALRKSRAGVLTPIQGTAPEPYERARQDTGEGRGLRKMSDITQAAPHYGPTAPAPHYVHHAAPVNTGYGGGGGYGYNNGGYGQGYRQPSPFAQVNLAAAAAARGGSGGGWGSGWSSHGGSF